MEITEDRIAIELTDHLELNIGDIVTLHSSLKSMGHVVGGAEALIRGILGSIGGPLRGTLMMPCFTNPAEVVDMRTAPCRLGLVPEIFRTFPGVIRSSNVSHSVAAIGRIAADLIAGHENCEPLGVNSPYHKFAEAGGYVLHIGCNLKTSSIIHVAESLAHSSYLHIPYNHYAYKMRLVIDESEGREVKVRENPGCSKRFIRVQQELERRDLLTKGKVGLADVVKAKGSDVLQVALEMLRDDAFAFLCDDERCTLCHRRKKAMGVESN
jgi:aminoglycoside 3-N-acetyltransferase